MIDTALPPCPELFYTAHTFLLTGFKSFRTCLQGTMLMQDRSTYTRSGHSCIRIRRKPSQDVVSRMTDGLLPPPLAVRNMLRTTTELGDMSNFDHLDYMLSLRPRLQSTRPRSGSFSTSFASALRHNESPPHHRARRHHAHFQPAQSLWSNRYGTARSSPSMQGFRHKGMKEIALTQSMFLQGLTDPQSSIREYQSLTTLQSYPQIRLSEMSSAESQRCPRPGPTKRLWNTMQSFTGPSRPHLFVGGDQMSTTSLPVMYFDQRYQPNCQYHHNHSVPSSLHLPSRVASFASLSLPGTIPHLPTQGSRSTLTTNFGMPFEIKRDSDKELVVSPGVDSVPRYYDYSESFIEGDSSLAATKAPNSLYPEVIVTSEAVVRLPSVQTLASGGRIAPAKLPAELPTIHNRRPSEQAHLQPKTDVFELESIEIDRNVENLPLISGHEQQYKAVPQSCSTSELRGCRPTETPPKNVEKHIEVAELDSHASAPPDRGSAVLESEVQLDEEGKDKRRTRNGAQGCGMGSDDSKTPQKITHPVTSPSHGGSTIDSLLEKHIDSLGLMPEPESPISYSSEADTSSCEQKGDSEYIKQHTRNVDWGDLDIQSHLQDLPGLRVLSLDSRATGNLRLMKKTKRTSRRYSTGSQLVHVLTNFEPVEMSIETSKPSPGWQTLPSTSREQSQMQIWRPSLASGDMADIDTNVCSLTTKTWSYSQFNLPTSLDDEAFDCQTFSTQGRRRSWDVTERSQRAQARRRMGFCVGHYMLRSKSDDILCSTSTLDTTAARKVKSLVSIQPAPLRSPHTARWSPMDHEIGRDSGCLEHVNHETRNCQPSDGISTMPNRWSGIIAAMPLPPSNTPKLGREVSQRSQRSQHSYRNVVEPLNNSRQQAPIPLGLGPVPQLAAPDLGPPLDTSTLNLSIPYAETPSTIRPSPQNAHSFFDDSPTHPSRIGAKPRLGLRSLRSLLYGSRAALLPARLNVLDQGSEASNMFGPQRGSTHHLFKSAEDTETCRTAGGCVGHRKQVVRKWKEWWKIKLC